MTEGNDFLSQDELDALLGAINSGNADGGADNSSAGGILSPEESDMIGEVGNMIMGSASTALFTILGKEVDITTPQVSTMKLQDIKDKFNDNRVVTTLDFSEGIDGLNVLVVDVKTAAIIADLMMGGEGTSVDETLDDIKLSAVGEAMNQMMGAAATAMAEFLSTPVNISPPQVSMMDFTDEMQKFPPLADSTDQDVVLISFDMVIKELSKTQIFQIMPIKFVQELYRKVSGGISEPAQPQAAVSTPPPAANTPPPSMQQPQQQMMNMPPPPQKTQPVSVNPVEFENFGEAQYMELPKQLELLYDVPLEITVELGRSKKTLKDILDLNIGSIIELDKLTGEHVDILVNGRIIAKGEVVVVEESFGVRVTQIVDPRERLRNLK